MIWYKSDILEISENLKEQWFDVYNYQLLEDRAYDISHMTDIEVDKAKTDIKNSYMDYLLGLSKKDDFVFYSYIEKDKKIIAVTRLMINDNAYYIEGLETHRDFRHQGYAKMCIQELLMNCEKLKIERVYSIIREYNIGSINTHKSCGFKTLKKEGNNLIMLHQMNQRDKINFKNIEQ